MVSRDKESRTQTGPLYSHDVDRCDLKGDEANIERFLRAGPPRKGTAFRVSAIVVRLQGKQSASPLLDPTRLHCVASGTGAALSVVGVADGSRDWDND